MQYRHILAAAALAAALPLGAQTLKPGLWEISNRTNNPEIDQAMAEVQKHLASMPPEQRKQMEAMMAQRGVQMAPAGSGMVAQVCFTREMLDNPGVPADRSDCKVTNQSRSGNTIRVAYACPNPPTSGESVVTVAGPEAYTSKTTVRTTVDGKAQTMTVESTGRWLKADCGNIKPVVPPKK